MANVREQSAQSAHLPEQLCWSTSAQRLTQSTRVQAQERDYMACFLACTLAALPEIHVTPSLTHLQSVSSSTKSTMYWYLMG